MRAVPEVRSQGCGLQQGCGCTYRRGIAAPEQFVKAEPEQPAVGPLEAVDQHCLRHREENDEARWRIESKDALVDRHLRRVLAALRDVLGGFDVLELLAPEFYRQRIQQKFVAGWTRNLNDPDDIPSRMVASAGQYGDQLPFRIQLELGMPLISQRIEP